jgi:hypothetical protein
MRTTLAIDDDVLQAARQLADATGRSLGEIVSELARRSLTASDGGSVRNGIRLLPASRSGARATLAEVNELRDNLR